MVVALMRRWQAEQERQDYRAGMITSAIYNTIRDAKKRPQPFDPQDFMPERVAKPKAKPMTAEATLAFFEQLNRALGGVDLREKATA